ncbi:hypothetical protein Godav_006695, partial [Gossypium davidsonii]|nr:hypothetical protein [Gossypium davidsonii]
MEGYMSELWDFTRISVTQNNLQELKEEYITLLRCLRIQVNKAYSRAANVPTFLKKIMNITGMSEQWDTKKRVNVFALSIYRLVIYPKALRHIDE